MVIAQTDLSGFTQTDLKTDNQEVQRIWSLHKMRYLLDLHKKRDLKTDK